MVRTQIQLTEQQAVALKRLAIERGVSMAELIRQSVDRLIQTTSGQNHSELIEQLTSLAGKYGSGIADLAKNHDDYLDEIYGDGGA
ncbi:MAG: CopG family transcriptional regulator [Chloroflexi bacterium]|nr:MAG: CopG family transcriptional regulator [Chloroflexota bacterium]